MGERARSATTAAAARRALAGWLFAMLPALGVSALAQSPVGGAASAAAGTVAVAAPAVPAEQAPPPAVLQVFNRDIVEFRAVLLGIAPRERVRRARERVQEQLQRGVDLTVSLLPVAGGQAVLINGGLSFLVLDADADPLRPGSGAELARQAARALEQAIAERHESRDWRRMLHAAGRAVLISAGAALLGWGLWRLRRAVERHAVRLAERHATRLRIGGAPLLRRERLGATVPRLLGVPTGIAALLLAEAWLSLVLAQFPYTRPWGEQLDDALLGLLASLAASLVAAVPGLVTAGLVFVLARWATRALSAFFARVQAGQIRLGWLDADLAGTTRRIVNAVVWVFALVMAYPYLPGAQTEAFKGVSVLVGLMISLGASNLVGQAASGLILAYTRVLRRGEYVRIADHEGTVTDPGLFSTRLRTGLGEELTLPNSLILANVTRNYSRTVQGPGYVLDTVVTIGYDTPWRQVEAMLLEAARRTPGVLATPAPHVFQTALSDFYPEYRLVCQAVPAEPRPRAQVLHLLHAHIQDVFAEQGVQIMSPHYHADPAETKLPTAWDGRLRASPPAAAPSPVAAQDGRARS